MVDTRLASMVISVERRDVAGHRLRRYEPDTRRLQHGFAGDSLLPGGTPSPRAAAIRPVSQPFATPSHRLSLAVGRGDSGQ